MDYDKGKYLSIEQISKYCDVNEESVKKWISKGLMGANNKKKKVLLEDFIYFLNIYKIERPLETKESDLKVLVIDDELNVANVIGDVFLHHGFNVATSKDAIQAGCLINSDHPQIVTIDLGMSVFDGLDVLKIIKGLHLEEKVWTIVISGGNEKTLQEAIGLGADCYLQKPFSSSDLDKIINKFFPDQHKHHFQKAS
jgi:CheY-like chemotaxis protein